MAEAIAGLLAGVCSWRTANRLDGWEEKEQVPDRMPDPAPEPPKGVVGLLRHAYEEGTGHLAVLARQWRIVDVIVPAKDGRVAGVRVFIRQGFIGRRIMGELGIDNGLAVLGEDRALRADKILAIVGEDGGVELPACR